MIFETIPAGETRQLNGPYWGVRVLSSQPAAGAALTLDGGLPLPISALVAIAVPEHRPIFRVVASGPIILAIADVVDDDLAGVSSPEPTAADLPSTQYVVVPAGSYPIGTVLATWVRPYGARGVAIFGSSLPGSLYVCSYDAGGTHNITHAASALTLPSIGVLFNPGNGAGVVSNIFGTSLTKSEVAAPDQIVHKVNVLWAPAAPVSLWARWW